LAELVFEKFFLEFKITKIPYAGQEHKAPKSSLFTYVKKTFMGNQKQK
jgi:hypothetical protein